METHAQAGAAVGAPGRRSSWRLLQALALDLLATARSGIVTAGAVVLFASLFETASLAVVAPLLAIATGEQDARWTSMLEGLGTTRWQQASVLLGLFAAAMLIRNVLVAARQVSMARLEGEYLTARQFDVVRLLGQAPWPIVSRLRHARITSLLGTDIYRVGQAATGLLEGGVALITLAVQLAVALWLEPRLTALALVLVLAGAVLTLPLLRAAREVGDAVTATNMALLNDAGQFLGALKLAASQNLQGRFVADFRSGLDELVTEEVGYVRRQNVLRLRLSVLGLLVAVGTAWAGLRLFGVPVTTLVALLAILSRMAAPAGQLQAQLGELFRSLPAYEQLERLKEDLEGGPAPAALTAAPPAGDIRFDRVTHLHPGGVGGVRAISLDLREGSFLGIAGASGAGKTTFADLLVGLYAPSEGAITVGGLAVPLDRTPAWRNSLSYVSQDPFLRNESIRANLLWGAPDADDAAIQCALALSGADAVIARLPGGLDAEVGERGSLISGGERQRIALARALLRRPRLLILDEATNAIDVHTEREILARLGALRSEMTVVMIAHRLESLARCDEIVIFEGGRIVEHGSYAALKPRLAAVARED